MSSLQIPQTASEFLEKASGRVSRVWFGFLARIAQRLSNLEGVAAIASADVAAAPAAYTQAHMATVVALVNETKARVAAMQSALKE